MSLETTTPGNISVVYIPQLFAGVTYLQERLQFHKHARELLQTNITQLQETITEGHRVLEVYKQARVILQNVGQQTQQNLELHISNIVSLALNAVFPHPPQFKIEFVQRRNQTEGDLLFSDDGGENWYQPVLGSGGGPLDVASFALRVAFWSIRPNEPVLILDEPFRNVSPDLHTRVSEMLRKISDALELQIIIVSHAEDVNVVADRTFTIRKVNAIAQVTTGE